MSEVAVLQEQLELVNIVEVSQSKLVKNFTLLQRRLNRVDETFLHREAVANQQFQQTNRIIQTLEQRIRLQEQRQNETIQQLCQRIAALEEAKTMSTKGAEATETSVRRLNDELFNTQLQFQQKIKVKEKDLEEAMRNIHILALEQNRLNDEINKKENKVEAERIIKETEILKDKNAHFETELKMAHHKIEKIEILNEKAERLHAKKEVEIMKEIEERVKKELRISVKNGNQPSINQTNSSTMIQSQNFGTGSIKIMNNPSNFMRTESLDSYNQDLGRRPSILTEDQLHSLGLAGGESTRNVENLIEKWGDKIKYFEVQLKEIQQNLKVLNRTNNHKKTETNKENNEGIKDKINQIKPEVVKLWAKIDTIQDRLSFNERKLQEKMRGVSDLTSIIKENNVSRLEQKLKGLQTEIFTNLKEVKTKLETKVGQTQYDKYRQQMEDKIGQINDLIYLKSDKLQVKKALLFLQSKIKEIILVISQDQENQKDALLTKKQLKCISCDKELDKFSGIISSPKGNWDGLPFKDHPPEILGRFGMTNFGSLAKKIKKLESKDLPLLNKKTVNQSFQNSSS